MKTCDTCSFYKIEGDDTPMGFGQCTRWNFGYGIFPKDLAENEVLVENDEGWGMFSGPKFGCVLHQDKDVTTNTPDGDCRSDR